MIPRFTLAAAALLGLSLSAPGQVYINEVFFNPAGSDNSNEYIEIRGAASAALTNTYFVVIDSEATGNLGRIDAVFDLSAAALGSNGFLVMRQQGSPYTVNPNSAVLTAPGNPEFGDWGGLGTFASDLGALLESPSLTYMLIHAPGAQKPPVAYDADMGDDGLDLNVFASVGWTILDSISVLDGNSLARAYGRTVFFDAADGGQMGFFEDGAQFVGFDFDNGNPLNDTEAEWVARFGNSTGSDPADWIVADLASGSNPQLPRGHFNPGESTISPLGDGLNALNTIGTVNIPEPGCAALIGFATVGLAFRRRRQ